MKRARLVAVLLTVVGLAAGGYVMAQRPERPKRVRPPQWSQQDRDIFFRDVFNEALQGERPDNLGRPAGRRPVAGGHSGTPGGRPATAEKHEWSDVITAAALQKEIKKLYGIVDENVTSPGKFKSRGFRDARQHFGELAMLFGIVAEFDKDVKWRDDAPAARQFFSKTSGVSKAGTTGSYNMAKQAKQGLLDMLNGESFPFAEDAQPNAKWEEIADRSIIMIRLRDAQRDRLSKWTANEREFSDKKEEIAHEARVAGAITRLLKKDGLTDAGDEDYDSYCDQLTEAAKAIVEAVKLDNYDSARKAVSTIDQACSRCHEGYR